MLTNVATITSENYLKILKFSINSGGNLLVFGQAGIGKTEIPYQAVGELEYNYIYLNLSVLEYPDLVGLQIIKDDPLSGRKVVEYAAPKFLPLLPLNPPKTHKKKVIILDEVDKAKSELQNPLLELLQFHTINGAPIDVQSFILTGNLPDEGAFSRLVSHALTNRCIVYRLEHDFITWRNWAVDNNINPLIVGFLNNNQELLSQPPEVDDPTAYCRPSPRSWVMASQDLEAAPDASLDFQVMLVSGRVGTATAIKFQVWLEHYRHVAPTLEALVTNGTFPQETDLDRVFVCAISACSRVTGYCNNALTSGKPYDRAHLINTVNNVYTWINTLSPEVQVAAIKSTVKMDHVIKMKLTESEAFTKAIKEINKVIDL